MTDTSIFNAPEGNTDNEVDLIGEGKKYKDVPTANKALKDKDAFIESLKREAHEARQEAKTRMSLEEFWQKTQEAKKTKDTSTSNDTPQGVEERDEEVPQNKNVDISALVREALSKELTKVSMNKNVEETREQLKKLWGNDYVKTLKDKVEALGLGTDFVDSIAARSPTAFLALVGANAPAHGNNGNPNSQLPPTGSRTQLLNSDNNDGARTQKYYDELKKSDAKAYFSKEVQLQRHKDALALGEKFFKS